MNNIDPKFAGLEDFKKLLMKNKFKGSKIQSLSSASNSQIVSPQLV